MQAGSPFGRRVPWATGLAQRRGRVDQGVRIRTAPDHSRGIRGDTATRRRAYRPKPWIRALTGAFPFALEQHALDSARGLSPAERSVEWALSSFVALTRPPTRHAPCV